MRTILLRSPVKWIAAACVLAVLSFIVWSSTRTPSPTEVAKSVYEHIVAGRWGDIYDISLASHAKDQRYTRGQYIELMQLLSTGSTKARQRLQAPVLYADNRTNQVFVLSVGPETDRSYFEVIKTPRGWKVLDDNVALLVGKLSYPNDRQRWMRAAQAMKAVGIEMLYYGRLNATMTREALETAGETGERPGLRLATRPRSYDW
jgi:hypothetical protein